MKQAITYIFTGDNNSDIPDELHTFHIDVSFDMGWQKSPPGDYIIVYQDMAI